MCRCISLRVHRLRSGNIFFTLLKSPLQCNEIYLKMQDQNLHVVFYLLPGNKLSKVNMSYLDLQLTVLELYFNALKIAIQCMICCMTTITLWKDRFSTWPFITHIILPSVMDKIGFVLPDSVCFP